MVISGAELHLQLQGVESLKDKRKIIRSLVERLGRNSGLAISEVGDHDLWGNAVIGIAVVSDHAIKANSVLDRLVERVEEDPRIELREVIRDLVRL